MYVGNCLNAGDFLTVVPVGIPIRLQYNENGNLHKVFLGFEDRNTEITSDVLEIIIHNNIVPLKIGILNGTTWVKGVLYTSELCNNPGLLPDCVQNELLTKFKLNPSKFSFHAGDADSLATPFHGVVAIRQWLSMSGFKVLPGYLVPTGFDRQGFIDLIDTPQYPFQFPLIASYIISSNAEIKYVSTRMTQFIVSRVVKYVDDYGNIKAKIYKKTDDESANFICVDYTEVVNYNIQTNSLVILDSGYQIIFTSSTDGKIRDKRSNKLECSYCGKSFTIPEEGIAQCPDIHCPSRMLPCITRFLTVANLPVPTNEVIRHWIDNKEITCIPDLFTLDLYKSVTVDMTIAKVIKSLVPITIILRDDIFTLFANKCSNSLKSVEYYINHPNKISTDLDISHPDVNKFINWLLDDYNLSDLSTLLFSTEQIKIVDNDKKFDGAPIFRNKLICITGKFIHGDVSEITAILQSYSAKVTTEFSNSVDCIITGSTMEGINGVMLKNAQILGVPVFDEVGFFNQYEIDSDLKENLL
jgi:hypothetical protein